MTGALIRNSPHRWSGILRKFRSSTLIKLQFDFPNYPYPDLIRAIQVSVDALPTNIRVRYFELSVLPEDTLIPEAAIIVSILSLEASVD